MAGRGVRDVTWYGNGEEEFGGRGYLAAAGWILSLRLGKCTHGSEDHAYVLIGRCEMHDPIVGGGWVYVSFVSESRSHGSTVRCATRDT